MLEKSSDSLEEGRANFARLLQQTDEEDDLALDLMDFEFSLLDPLSYQRMKIPVRSLRCSHVKCFDLENFMELYPEKANRNCPVCGKEIKLLDLRQDSFVKSILEQTNEDEDEVKMTMNGEWKHCEKEKNIEDVDDMDEEDSEHQEEELQRQQQKRKEERGLQDQGGGVLEATQIPEIPSVFGAGLPNRELEVPFYLNNANAYGLQFEQAIPSVEPTAGNLAHHLYHDFSSLLNAAQLFDNNEIIDLVSCSSVEDEPDKSSNNKNIVNTNSTTSMYNTNRDPNLGSEIEIIDITD